MDIEWFKVIHTQYIITPIQSNLYVLEKRHIS